MNGLGLSKGQVEDVFRPALQEALSQEIFKRYFIGLDEYDYVLKLFIQSVLDSGGTWHAKCLEETTHFYLSHFLKPLETEAAKIRGDQALIVSGVIYGARKLEFSGCYLTRRPNLRGLAECGRMFYEVAGTGTINREIARTFRRLAVNFGLWVTALGKVQENEHIKRMLLPLQESDDN